MKKIAAMALVFGLGAALPACAEYKVYTKKITCAPLAEVLEDLSDKNVKELPFWIGISNDPEIRYSVMVNKRTDTWTIIQYNRGAACVISIGENNQFLNSGEKN
jgi:hypothetical protein